MQPAADAACDLCGCEIGTEPAEHYRGHLENAKGYLRLLETHGGEPSWSATAREWIQHCEKVLAEPEAGTVN